MNTIICNDNKDFDCFIRKMPDPILKQKCETVKVVDKDIQHLVSLMIKTMKKYNGSGLAANQIGISKRVIVINSFEEKQDRCFINPEIIKSSKRFFITEGCLSVPYRHVTVKRASIINVKFLDLDGIEQEEEFKLFDAVVIQHEIDHLNGKTILERIR